MILQKYDFSSKSQLITSFKVGLSRCLWYCKSTIFQANHNSKIQKSAKHKLFVILQKYDFSSKSQPKPSCKSAIACCLWYCKSTIFQANHNLLALINSKVLAACDTAKVRFFKQITTYWPNDRFARKLFVILQKYDFSSKSQLVLLSIGSKSGCLWYCKSTIFQANHNLLVLISWKVLLFVILQKYDFSSKSQPLLLQILVKICCLWYCKSTIFQANHNWHTCKRF